MSSWNGKSKGNVLGYRIFVWLLRNGGLGAAYFVLRIVSLYYFLFSFKTTSCLFFYFRKRLGFNWVKSLISVYRNYYVFGQTLIDKVYVNTGDHSSLSYSSEGEEYLYELIRGEKGGILISAHIGNWDVAGQLLSMDAKINIVLYEAEHAKIKEYLSRLNIERKINIINVNNSGFEHIYKISEALDRRELVCLHGDRFVKGSKTERHSFLGQQAEFPIGPFILATQMEVPVSFVYAMKDSAYHYHFYASKPWIPTSKSGRKEREKEAKDLMNAYVGSLENIISRYPEQWFNYYKFWEAA